MLVRNYMIIARIDMNELFVFFKYFFNNIYYWLYILFSPSYWIQIHTYSKQYDKKLNELLKKYDFEDSCNYYSKLGKLEVWIKNHPYGSYSIKVDGRFLRPSRMTIAKAHKKRIEQKNKKLTKKIDEL